MKPLWIYTLVWVYSSPQEIHYNELCNPSISWAASGIDWGMERVVIVRACFGDIPVVVQDVSCLSAERCKNHCEHQATVIVMILSHTYPCLLMSSKQSVFHCHFFKENGNGNRVAYYTAGQMPSSNLFHHIIYIYFLFLIYLLFFIFLNFPLHEHIFCCCFFLSFWYRAFFWWSVLL